MRYTDDVIVYAMPRRRVVDYGYSVDDSELARVESSARHISNQTIDEADFIRAASRRNDQAALDRVNQLMAQAQAPPSLPTEHLRAHIYPKAVDLYAMDQARSLAGRVNRSLSTSDLTEPIPRVVVVPAHTRYVPQYHRYPGVRYLPAPLSPAPVPLPHDYNSVRRVARPLHYPAPPVSDYRRRLERRLDTDLLTCEFPSAEAYIGLREHLRGVNDKLLAHRLLLDRYSGIEMSAPNSVEHNVESKCSELMARMPQRTRGSSQGRDFGSSQYAGSPGGEAPVSQIRNRLKKLIDRTKNKPVHY